MQPILARFLAVLLTVLPWASALLTMPRLEKPEASLSSPNSPAPPQASNANLTPSFNPASRDAAPIPFFTTLEANQQRSTATLLHAPNRVLSSEKLFLTYSRMQLEGA
jgi:hypothetical protein